MAKNKIEDLRNHLFETIELLKDGLKDEKDTEALKMTIEKAQAIRDLGQVIVNSAKVEVDFLKTIGSVGDGTGFFPTINNKKQIECSTS